MSKVLMVVFLIMFSSCAGYHYSEGERQGYVKKFSQKGFFFKTWEGELVQQIDGVLEATTFNFTVRDLAIVPKIKEVFKNQNKVELSYDENLYFFSFKGDTNYFIKDVKIIK